MTLIPYPNDPARLAATNPIFNDNGFVRGDEQRLNNSEIWANFTDLDERLIYVEDFYLPKGLINGGLEFNNSLPPKLRAGAYEVNGKLIVKSTETVLAWSDTFFNNLQSIPATSANFLVMMDIDGNVKYLMYGEGLAQASQSVTNSTGTTTKTLTVPTVPGSGTENYTAIISGNGSFTGVFKATRTSATTFTIPLSSDPGNSVTDMTVTLLFQIQTLHSYLAFPYPAALRGVVTSTDISKFSPSLGENTATNALATFDYARNGFYCTLTGLTNWRVLGSFNTEGGQMVNPEAVFSFKSGRNKNDNALHSYGVNSLVSKNLRWDNIEFVYGCDYIWYYSNATFGSAVVFQRGGRAFNTFILYYSSVTYFGIYSPPSIFAGVSAPIGGSVSLDLNVDHSVNVNTYANNLSNVLRTQKNSFVSCVVDAATLSDNKTRYKMVLDLD